MIMDENVKDDLEHWNVPREFRKVPKESEITQTSPPWLGEDHEKYSAEVSVAMRSS